MSKAKDLGDMAGATDTLPGDVLNATDCAPDTLSRVQVTLGKN